MWDKGAELLGVVGLRDKANELARNLPYGDQRRLELGRALGLGPGRAAPRRADRGDDPG